MTFYVAEIHPGLLESPMRLDPPDTPVGWRFFARCNADRFEGCCLWTEDLNALSRETRKAFAALWTYVLEAGKSGKPWNQIFQDGKLFHPVHEIKVHRFEKGAHRVEDVKIFQFKRKRTAIRVLFVNAGKTTHAFVTHAFEKDTKETPTPQKTRAEREATAFFEALDKGLVRLISQHCRNNQYDNIFN